MAENQLPEAFESQMQALVGPAEYVLFKESLERPTQASIRLNWKKPVDILFSKRPIPWVKDGYFLVSFLASFLKLSESWILKLIQKIFSGCSF